MKFFDLDQLDPQRVSELEENERLAKQAEEQQRFENRFKNRFESKSWLHSNADRRKRATAYTYICHVVSASGSVYTFTMLFGIFLFNWLGAVLALAGIILHEREKRRWSDKFWDYYYANKKAINWRSLAINASLFLLSVGITLGGAYFAIKDNMPGAKFMGESNDPAVVALQSELQTAQKDLAAFEASPSNKNSKGEIYYKRLDTYNSMQARVLDLKNQLQEGYGIMLVQNEQIRTDWKDRRFFLIMVALFICLACEVVFEWNMAFRSRFDYLYYQAQKIKLAKTSSGIPFQVNGNGINGNGEKKKLVPA